MLGCAILKEPMPPWVAEAWRSGWVQVQARLGDWNDLFGKVRLKTPKQLKRERVRQEQLIKLIKLLPSVQAPITRDRDIGVFHELAKKMGISARAVHELYYAQVEFDGEKIRLLPESLLRQRPSRKK
jgi:hypothetical protein